MKKVAFSVLVLTALAACGGESVHIISAKDLPAGVYGGPTEDSARDETVTVYMVDGNRLAPVSRAGRSRIPAGELVLRALLCGPTSQEIERGITTAIPTSVELRGVSIDGGVAEVDLNDAFQDGSSDELLRRVAQVVYTLSEIGSVNSVDFFTEGRRLSVPDQNNEPHNEPVAKARYTRFAPRTAFGSTESEGPLRLDVRGDEECAVP